MQRMPALENVGIRKFFNGPESFTPDVRYMLGEAPELRHFFVAAGFNSDRHPVGRRRRQGAGRVDRRRPSADRPVGRRHPPHACRSRATRTTCASASSEALGLLYAMHWPYRQYETGARRAPVAAARAAEGERRLLRRGGGLGAAQLVRRRRGVEPRLRIQLQAARTGSPYAAAEHKAVREAVGLFDMTSFAKFRVEGPRCRGRPAARLRQRRRRAGRARRLHPVAERARRHRGRPHRHPARRDRVHGGHRRRHRPRAISAGCKRTCREGADVAGRRTSAGSSPCSSVMGPQLARSCWRALTACRSVERGVPVRHLARDRDRRGARAAPPASPTSASSAGSCTCRPSSPRQCSTLIREAGAAAGPAARRHARDGQLPHRKGLPALGPRHRATRTRRSKPA